MNCLGQTFWTSQLYPSPPMGFWSLPKFLCWISLQNGVAVANEACRFKMHFFRNRVMHFASKSIFLQIISKIKMIFDSFRGWSNQTTASVFLGPIFHRTHEWSMWIDKIDGDGFISTNPSRTTLITPNDSKEIHKVYRNFWGYAEVSTVSIPRTFLYKKNVSCTQPPQKGLHHRPFCKRKYSKKGWNSPLRLPCNSPKVGVSQTLVQHHWRHAQWHHLLGSWSHVPSGGREISVDWWADHHQPTAMVSTGWLGCGMLWLEILRNIGKE